MTVEAIPASKRYRCDGCQAVAEGASRPNDWLYLEVHQVGVDMHNHAVGGIKTCRHFCGTCGPKIKDAINGALTN